MVCFGKKLLIEGVSKIFIYRFTNLFLLTHKHLMLSNSILTCSTAIVLFREYFLSAYRARVIFGKPVRNAVSAEAVLARGQHCRLLSYLALFKANVAIG